MTFTSYFRHLLLSLVTWTMAMTSFMIFRYYGLEYEGFTSSIKNSLSFLQYVKFGFFVGIFFGVLYSMVYLWSEKYLSKRLSIGLVLLIKFSVFIILLTLSLSIIGYILYSNYETTESSNYHNWWLIILYYAIMVSFVLSIMQIGIERLGICTFYKILIGSYKKPKEEENIFMFLDLKSSTQIAEKLEHFKYSQFIQDCFYELNEVVNKHEAQIYQYVGDEAVLVWNYKNGIQNSNCVTLFFSFLDRLESRASYFNEKYKVFPEFKAGVHGGKLMVTEVGTVKKEIAYHGDVINTAARIQSKCNEFNQKLIISDSLIARLELSTDLKKIDLGELELKGKEEKLKLYGIIR